MKIRYEVDSTGHCTTPCPFKKGVVVGGIVCDCCGSNVEQSNWWNFVICSYKEFNIYGELIRIYTQKERNKKITLNVMDWLVGDK